MRKRSLVTGGGTGIGRSAVLALAKAGYDVAINYASSAAAAGEVAAQAQALGARTLLLQCDVSDDAAVRAMMGQVEAEFGHLDALVNTPAPRPSGRSRISRAWTWTNGTAPSRSTSAAISRSRGRRALAEEEPRAGRRAGRRVHGEHRRPASGPAAAAVLRQQGRPHQPDQDAGLEPGARHPASTRWRPAGWKASGWSGCSATSTTR